MAEPPRFERILLASEGREIPDPVVDRVVGMCASTAASVHVLSIARVHGVAFGLQSPGLLPTKREWVQQRALVDTAVKRLRRKGIETGGQVLGTRRATKAILASAAHEKCQAIVMGSDPDRNRIVGDLLWSQEPQRVRRRAKLPVYLVLDRATGGRADGRA